MESVKLNKKIYSLEAIKQAIKEFSNLAHFEIIEADGYFEIKIGQADKEVERVIGDEFTNYVLGLMG